jgi:multidrug resistance efflux pump
MGARHMTYDQRLADCEAELQKRDRKLRVFEMNLSASNGALANRIADLNEANKLLEQTIEVLEGVAIRGPDFDWRAWWWRKAKPLLDNLKAREKNHGSA